MPTRKTPLTKDEAIAEEMQRRDEAEARRRTRREITIAAVHQRAASILSSDLKVHAAHTTKLVAATRSDMKKLVKSISGTTASKSEEEAWQIVSDLHHCRSVDGHIDETTTTGALNTYRQHCDQLLWRQRRHVTVRTLNLAIIGDILHGVGNYAFQATEVSGNASYQIAKTAMLLINHINQERPHYERVRIVCVPGNHGRRNRDTDVVTDNLELDMYRIVEAYYHDSPDVQVQVIDNDVKGIINSLGRPVAVMHGDFLKSGTPQGILEALRKLEDTWPEVTSMYMGHWHRLQMLPLTQKYGEDYPRFLYVNGTASIDDEYLARLAATPTLAWWYNFSNEKQETATYRVGLYQDGITIKGKVKRRKRS